MKQRRIGGNSKTKTDLIVSKHKNKSRADANVNNEAVRSEQERRNADVAPQQHNAALQKIRIEQVQPVLKSAKSCI